MSGTTRRQWGAIIGGGILAATAGASIYQRRERAASAAAANPAAGTGPIPTPLKTLAGRTLAADDAAGRVVVLNFWAPWCPPCVREMPELDRFAHSPAGKDALVVGLAIDEQPNVEKFVAAHPVGFPVAVLGYAGLAWVRRLSNDPNIALPFSAVYDRSGKLVQRKFGPTSEAELAGWAQHL